LNGAELAGSRGYGAIPKDGGSRHPRRDLFEQLKVFRTHAVFQHDKTRSIAARPGHAVDETSADRIDDASKNDRYSAGRLQHRRHCCGAGC
jgi:hypothetical protein